MKMAPYS